MQFERRNFFNELHFLGFLNNLYKKRLTKAGRKFFHLLIFIGKEKNPSSKLVADSQYKP